MTSKTLYWLPRRERCLERSGMVGRSIIRSRWMTSSFCTPNNFDHLDSVSPTSGLRTPLAPGSRCPSLSARYLHNNCIIIAPCLRRRGGSWQQRSHNLTIPPSPSRLRLLGPSCELEGGGRRFKACRLHPACGPTCERQPGYFRLITQP